MNILVTGGSGMVGRSLQKIRPEWTYLSSEDCDLTRELDIHEMLHDHNPDCIIHLAARVGGIMDNINCPAEYFDQNVLMNTMLLRYAREFGVKRFIGILSTCIYPDQFAPTAYPLTEDRMHEGPPTPTNFSYGYAKRCLAVQIEAYNKQYGTQYQYLTPCNLYGEFDKYGENSHFIPALIKKIHYATLPSADSGFVVPEVNLLGTGTPLRQFMHSDDLAKVIVHCLDNGIYTNMNVAADENLSIREMAEIAAAAMNKNVVFNFDVTKPDGQFTKEVSTKLLKQVYPNWNPVPLSDGIKQTYNYLLTNNLFK